MASDERPVLRVVRGTPDDEELAALAAVLTAATAGPGRPQPATHSGWADPRARLRRPIEHGPGAWRSSAFPG